MRYVQHQPAPVPEQGEILPVDRITPRPSLHFVHDPGSLQSLAASIRAVGLRRPIAVRRTGNGRYIIVSGNRRFMACRMLGMSHVRVRILAGEMRLQPVNVLMDALITRRLHYLEAAEAMRTLHERHGMSLGDLANLLHLHPQAIADQMQLTTFGEELCALLMDEDVPLSIALLLLRLPDAPVRMDAAVRIARERLCIRDAALLLAAVRQKQHLSDKGVPFRDKPVHDSSQNHNRIVVGIVRDQRLYLNAIREIVGQMQCAGVDATLREEQSGTRLEMTLSVSTRKRRAARYQSM